MPQFNDEWLKKVKSSVNIVDIIGKSVSLKPSGKNYVGLCPFHDEKTPSFSVNPDGQFFYCFGCGAGGNVFNFIMRTESVDFPEAVIQVAKSSGISVPEGVYDQGNGQKDADIVFNINQLAARYFYRLLRSPEGAKARQYLLNRSINAATAKTFFIGFSSDDWDGLLTFLESQGISRELADKAGLAIKGKKGYYDRFRGRVIFPICDHRGRFLGFGGRIIADSGPKYLNSPETIVFQKSRHLYGLNWSKQAIQASDEVIVVEGYTDCISLHKKGITNVVASLGTSFTEYHARLLSRFTKNVVIAFDGDVAGEKGSKRGLEVLRQAGLFVKVAKLPEGYDPDSFAQEHDLATVRQWIESALPLVEYLIKDTISRYDISNREGKLQASQELINILARLDSAIELDEYIGYAARTMNLDENSLRQEIVRAKGESKDTQLGNIQKKPHIITKNRYTNRDVRINGSDAYPKVAPSDLVERDILRWLLAKPDLVKDLIRSGLGEKEFENPDYRHLFHLLVSGSWDDKGEQIAERLFLLPAPSGDFSEYLSRFQIDVCSRGLSKIEEKLSALENQEEYSQGIVVICRLLKYFYELRKGIPFLKRNGKVGPLERGELG